MNGMDRIKIGDHRVNLQQIAHIYRCADGSLDIYFAFNGEQNTLQLVGNEAALLLAYWDADDEEIDRLEPLVNCTERPVPALIAEGLESDDEPPIISYL